MNHSRLLKTGSFSITRGISVTVVYNFHFSYALRGLRSINTIHKLVCEFSVELLNGGNSLSAILLCVVLKLSRYGESAVDTPLSSSQS